MRHSPQKTKTTFSRKSRFLPMIHQERRCVFRLLFLGMWLLRGFISPASSFIARQQHYPAAKRGRTFVGVGNWISGVAGIPPSQPLVKDEILRELVANTYLDKTSSDLQCVYKASRDGWSAIDFHQCVDGKGSGLVVALSRSGALFGGFNPVGWISSDDYRSSNAAFLWFCDKYGKPTKCSILSGGNAAIFDFATGGPSFGSVDLVLGPPKAAVMGGFTGPDMENLSPIAGNLKEGKSTIGSAYSLDKRWPVRGSFALIEVEVYCNNNIVALPQSSKPQSSKGWWPFR